MLRAYFVFFFSSRRRHTRFDCDWSSACALPIFSSTPTNAGPAAGAFAQGCPWSDARDFTVAVPRVPQRHGRCAEIGRASCRESVDLGGRRIIKKEKGDGPNNGLVYINEVYFIRH